MLIGLLDTANTLEWGSLSIDQKEHIIDLNKSGKSLGAPACSAKTTSNWVDHGVTALGWPDNSADLNPIENLCGFVKRRMRDTRPNNTDELKAAIKATWAFQL